MSRILRLMALCCAALCSRNTCAQQRVMTIDELFRLADEQSVAIRSFESGAAAAAEGVRAARAGRLPDVGVTASASFLGDGRLWNRSYGDGMSVDMPHFGNNFALEAQQVVYAGGAVRSGIRIAELEQGDAETALERSRQDTYFLLLGHYLNLYKIDNRIRVLRENLALTDRVLETMRARREQGTVLRNDITRYELQRETLALELQRTEDTGSILNHRLVTALHLPEGTEIRPDTTLVATDVGTLCEDDWQDVARENNLDLRRAQTGIGLSDEAVRLRRSERLPQVSLMAADHLDGPITIEVPVLNNNFNYWYVGVGIRYNIASLFKSGRRIRQAQFNAQRAREAYEQECERVDNAVQECYVNLLTAQAELRTRRKGVELADENYAVVSNRYANDLALLTDMIDAGNTKLGADLALVDARINLIYDYYMMKYVTHTL